ncbi:hypothetical protein [Fulvivirga sedimenti]|uniref:Uncharacterized protein n=1 Tax=Fulvivirga sedimenti TaxID=2879465 RepID=A0A9X1HUH5_9BACT|nr:hypothetical protein [Fulvivirga sedimenti]MCA6077921.1 hypothetical protein [Fulvivirga sedimenti]
METSQDVHVEVARIQKEIKNHLGLSSNDLMFEYSSVDGKVKLDLITINPRHSQSFLFHSVTGYDKVDALKKMTEYVRSYREKESSYTIQWIANGEKELHTSYFRASSVYNALDKLYYGRDMNQITVFSVVLNPVA